MQNKLHFAVTGKTAPELIAGRAGAMRPNMGLTTWKGDVVRKGDVTVAKNYLQEDEISELNRIVGMFLDFAEDQAWRRKQVFLEDWKTRLDDFLRFNERAVLPDAGRTTREEADRLAHEEYEHFAERRRIEAENAGLGGCDEGARTGRECRGAGEEVRRSENAEQKMTLPPYPKCKCAMGTGSNAQRWP